MEPVSKGRRRQAVEHVASASGLAEVLLRTMELRCWILLSLRGLSFFSVLHRSSYLLGADHRS